MDIEKLIPEIILDIRYATKNNFTKQQVYISPKAFVRKPVADALLKIQKELNNKGMSIQTSLGRKGNMGNKGNKGNIGILNLLSNND